MNEMGVGKIKVHASARGKRYLAKNIVEIGHKSFPGGRFLLRHGDTRVELSGDEAVTHVVDYMEKVIVPVFGDYDSAELPYV